MVPWAVRLGHKKPGWPTYAGPLRLGIATDGLYVRRTTIEMREFVGSKLLAINLNNGRELTGRYTVRRAANWR